MDRGNHPDDPTSTKGNEEASSEPRFELRETRRGVFKIERVGPDEHEGRQEKDTPIIKQLKRLDDQYLAIEQEYEAERIKLREAYTERQRPILEQRSELLAKAADGEPCSAGTPGCESFWLKALTNHPSVEEHIEEWDAPVLQYLMDISTTIISEGVLSSGFRIDFNFAENPYFTNRKLWKAFAVKQTSPYTQERIPIKNESSEIDWRPEKDITFQQATKVVRGFGSRAGNSQKHASKEPPVPREPRDSFFRRFFRTVEPGMPLPVGADDELDGLSGDADDRPASSRAIEMLMGGDLEVGEALRDQIVPFAVRWYTGEARPDEDGSSDDGDDDDEGEDDDSISLGSSDAGSGSQKDGRAAPAKQQSRKTPINRGRACESGKKNEDCKQQ